MAPGKSDLCQNRSGHSYSSSLKHNILQCKGWPQPHKNIRQTRRDKQILVFCNFRCGARKREELETMYRGNGNTLVAVIVAERSRSNMRRTNQVSRVKSIENASKRHMNNLLYHFISHRNFYLQIEQQFKIITILNLLIKYTYTAVQCNKKVVNKFKEESKIPIYILSIILKNDINQ